MMRDVISVGHRKFEVIWTPGHAPGHCVIYLRKEKVMIVGDHLLPKITPHVGLYPDATGDPLGDFINSQQKVQKFDVEHVLPAHGNVYSDHRHRANQLIEHHQYREAEMLDLIREKAADRIRCRAANFRRRRTTDFSCDGGDLRNPGASRTRLYRRSGEEDRTRRANSVSGYISFTAQFGGGC